LPGGDYELHLSGANGLVDLGGNPLSSNDASGDYVVRFSQTGAPRGTAGDPLRRTDQEPNDDIHRPQDLGTLFPHELKAGVTVVRDFRGDPSQAPSDTADVYRFQLVQHQTYSFLLSGDHLPAGLKLTLTGPSGESVGINSLDGGRTLFGDLSEGTYLLTAGGWTADRASDISYRIRMTYTASSDNAPPLLAGPEPELALRLDSIAPPTVPTPPPPVLPPAPPPPPVVVVTPPPPPSNRGGETSGGPVFGPLSLTLGVGPVAVGGGVLAPGLSGAPSSPQAAPIVTIAVPFVPAGATANGPAASTDLVALASGSIGGERGADGVQATLSQFGQETTGPPSLMTTSVLVATIMPPWIVLPLTPPAAPGVVDEVDGPREDEQPAAAVTEVDPARLGELADRLAASVPPAVKLWAVTHPLPWYRAIIPGGAEPVAPDAADGAVEALDGKREVLSYEAGGVSIPGDWNRTWLVVLASTSVATLLYARRRVTGPGKEHRVEGPVRGAHQFGSNPSSGSLFRSIPRTSLTFLRGAPRVISSAVPAKSPTRK
jgi:hypothetical protein